MRNSADKTRKPSKKRILSAIDTYRYSVPKIIEDIVAYNRTHPEEPVEIDALGKNRFFIQGCAGELNELYKTSRREAKRLTASFRGALTTRAARIIFNVWCDVNKIIDGTEADDVPKKPKKR